MPFDAGFLTNKELDLAILRAARDGISKPGGWCQHCPADGHGAHCALGWIQHIGGGHRAVRWLQEALPPRHQEWGVPCYNDSRWRTQRQMVRLFDRAIRLRENAA